MKRPIEDYIALALIADLEGERNYFSSTTKEYTGSWDELRSKAETLVGFQIPDPIFRAAVRALSDCDLVRVTEDKYSGTFVKIYRSKFAEFTTRAEQDISKAKEEDDDLGLINKPSDYRAAHALMNHELFEDYKELGDEWIKRALEGLRQRVEEAGSLEALTNVRPEASAVPASDRIVSLSHNEVAEFEAQATEVIDQVEALNGIDGEPGLRELVVGQLKAGRELLRAGSFKLFVMQATLIEALLFLAKRYERETIGGLAGALAVALLKHFGIEA